MELLVLIPALTEDLNIMSFLTVLSVFCMGLKGLKTIKKD